ncbi:DUF559 domain-containing protein [Nocardia sp. NPDC060259]|uniref:DUF559 domain-containing protein n=1 Tax=Nocardia sp. NPDC060259 TaxID=3347088 RepID=UPI00366851D1
MDRVVTRAQLAAEGVASSTIGDRCRRGVYLRLLPGVFCVGEPTAFARCAAIIEWLPDACLSHRTAAWLRAMLPEPELFEATVPSSRYRKTPPWLRLYRRDLPEDAVDHTAELPMTTAAHTVLDWEFHSDRVTFRRDRRRQNWLVIHGWFVLRYSAHDVLRNLDECVDEVERVVRRRRFGRGLA